MGMRTARYLLLLTAVSAALVISAHPVLCQELILSAHENCSLGNCTALVEDIDTQAAKVWLNVSSQTGPLLIQVLGVNDTLFWGNWTLTVTRIYAGESTDLVWLRINQSD